MKIFIATPMFGSQCAGIYTDSMLRAYDMYARVGLGLQHKFEYNGSLIPILRTNLAHDFLNSDATHLLFIDADIGFDPRYILEILNVQLSTGLAIVGAPYLKKNIHWQKVADYLQSGGDIKDVNHHTGGYALETLDGVELDTTATAPVEVKYIGAGFTLIPRETFALFKSTFPEYTYGGGTRTMYFTSGIQDDIHVSEDVFFCNQIREAGGRIGCCPWMKISHQGNYVYGDPRPVMR